MHVLLIEDNPDHIEIIAHRLKRLVDCDPLETHGNSVEALAAAQAHVPDLILLDFRLGDEDGLAVLEALRDAGVHSPVVVLTAYGDEYLAAEATRMGAAGYVAKDHLQDPRFDKVIRRVLDEAGDWRKRQESIGQTQAGLAQITPREREVLDHIIAGKTNKEIAQALFRSVQTIKIHRASLMHKLDAHTPADLARKVIVAEGRDKHSDPPSA
ncbi:MAG: response regulator transcription factor [Planctomycetota bacterium]